MIRKAVAVSALLAAACGHLDQVDITRTGTATVPGVPGGAPLPPGAFALDLAVGRDALAQQGIDPNDVDSARLTELRLETVAGTSLEAWLDRVAFYVEGPGLARVLVAERRGIGALPAGTRTVDLEVTGVDLKPYLVAQTAKVSAEATGTVPPENTTVRATATVRVDVNVTGLFH